MQALEHILVEQQAELVKELEPDVLRVVRDQNGNHVIQKVIELVPRQYIGFIMDAFRGQVSQLAAHTYGCRVVQRLLEHGSEADRRDILEELHAAAQFLITDQYGNYVTQHVIQHGAPEDRAKMIALVTSQLLTLSKHKFASNVVEKCIEHGTPEQRRQMREELTAEGPDGTSPLQTMMKDQYGNYVIRKCPCCFASPSSKCMPRSMLADEALEKLLNQLEGAERESFIAEMRPQFISLKKTSTGRQIAAIDRLMTAAQQQSPSASGAPHSASQPATTAPTGPRAKQQQTQQQSVSASTSQGKPGVVANNVAPSTVESSAPVPPNAAPAGGQEEQKKPGDDGTVEEAVPANTTAAAAATAAEVKSCPEVKVDVA